MLISSRFCQIHLTQHYGDSTLHSAGVILATLSSLIKPFVCRLLLFDTSCSRSQSSLLFLPCHLWLPPFSSSTSVSSNHLTPFQIHPHQLADSVHFTQRAQCSDPHESMADKSMLSLFSMPLLPSIFFPCYFAVCGDLNFAQLNWVHFQEQILTVEGFQFRDSR